MMNNMPYTPLPPEPHFDFEAERAVLGALLENYEILPSVKDILGADKEAFYKVPHQIIYQACIELFDRQGNFDPAMVAIDISQKDEINRVGGHEEIHSLAHTSPAWENFEYYANIVREKHFRRQIAQLSKQAAALSRNMDIEGEGELAAKLEELFANMTQARKAEVQIAYDIMGDVVEEIQSRTEKRLAMSSGFRELDEMTAGFHEGDMMIVAGRPSMGKTSIAIQMARHLAYNKNIPVAFYSYEMKKEALIKRLLARDTGISYHRLDSDVLGASEKDKIKEAYKTYEGKPLYIFDKGYNIHELASHVRFTKHTCDIKVAFYDYLQIIPADRRYSGDTEKITYYSNRLKAIAQDNDICSVALSQLSRASERRVANEPRLSDLRDSGALEQDADVVMLVHRPGMYDSDDNTNAEMTKLILAKNRNGPRGDVFLRFDGQTFSFKES